MTQEQQNFIERLKRIFKVEESLDKSGSRFLGYSMIENGKYKVVLKKTDPNIMEIVRVHEYGHIYYDHLTVDSIKEYKVIQDIYTKLCPEEVPLTSQTLARVLNICMDIEINSTLLEEDQVQDMYDFMYPICIPRSYGAPPALRFNKYYEYVLKKEDIMNIIKKGMVTKLDIEDLLGPLINPSPNSGSDISAPTQNAKSNQDSDKVSKSESGSLPESTPESESKSESESLPESTPESESKSSHESTNPSISIDDKLETDSVVHTEYKENSEWSGNRGISWGGSGITGFIKVKNTDIKTITSLILSIIEYSNSLLPDSVRITNRKCRGNTNLFYSSMKHKINKNKKPLLQVIVDTSVSMPSKSVRSVLSGISNCKDKINPESLISVWDSRKLAEFKIRDLKDSTIIPLGGNNGLVDAIKDAKANKIIIISDFYDDLIGMKDAMKPGTDYYSIITGNVDDSRIDRLNIREKSFFEKCKKNIYVLQK